MQIFHNVNEPESRRGQHIPTYIRIYILSIYLGFLFGELYTRRKHLTQIHQCLGNALAKCFTHS